MADELTHLDDEGAARMVDVSAKEVTARAATARGFVYFAPDTFDAARRGDAHKGDVLQVARLAGILAAKRTGELIPLCHPLGLDHVDVRFAWLDAHHGVAIEATARCTGRTGVEMEALTAASVAALTIFDMCKAIDRSMRIADLHVSAKSGGRSGDWALEPAPGPPLDDAVWS